MQCVTITTLNQLLCGFLGLRGRLFFLGLAFHHLALHAAVSSGVMPGGVQHTSSRNVESMRSLFPSSGVCCIKCFATELSIFRMFGTPLSGMSHSLVPVKPTPVSVIASMDVGVPANQDLGAFLVFMNSEERSSVSLGVSSKRVLRAEA